MLRNFLDDMSFERNNRDFRLKNLIIFVISLSLYLLNNNFLHSINQLFSFYFNDLLAIIALVSFVNFICKYKVKNFWIILFFTILASFVWEYLALFIKAGSVFDFLDIICYFISMFIYLALIYMLGDNIDFNY